MTIFWRKLMSPHWSPAYNWVWEPPIKVDTARWTQKTHQPLHRVGPRSSLFPQWSVSTHTHTGFLALCPCPPSSPPILIWISNYGSVCISIEFIVKDSLFQWVISIKITTDVDWHLVIGYMKMYFKAYGIHMSSTINVWNLISTKMNEIGFPESVKVIFRCDSIWWIWVWE